MAPLIDLRQSPDGEFFFAALNFASSRRPITDLVQAVSSEPKRFRNLAAIPFAAVDWVLDASS